MLRYATQECPMFKCAFSGLMKGPPCLYDAFKIYLSKISKQWTWQPIFGGNLGPTLVQRSGQKRLY